MDEQTPQSSPEPAQYAQALRQLAITDAERALLVAHYNAPEHSATAKQLAESAGLSTWQAVNSQYGRLGTKLREAIGFRDEGQQSYVIASFLPPGSRGNAEWMWVMHPALAEATEILGWVTKQIA